MNEVLDAVSMRIKSPYFGYSVLAFVALNWRGVFLLAVSSGSPQLRLAAFDEETNAFTLIIAPLLIGGLVAASAPWIRYVFSSIAKKPLQLTDNIQLESDHQKIVRKTELEQTRSEFFANKEKELIGRAKRDEEVQEIEDEDLKQELAAQIESLRRERDQLSETLNSRVNEGPLSTAETDLLRAAAKDQGGSIMKMAYIGGRQINAGSVTFGAKDSREYAKYESALKSLVRKGLLQAVGPKGETFELTHSGWEVADAL